MEGFVDVLAANRAGVYNAVATMGTSLHHSIFKKSSA